MLDKVKAKITLNRFLQKRLLYYIVPNMAFNTLVAYASFAKAGYTCLFEGEQSIARLTLPMSLLLPFIITLDIINRTTQAIERGTINLLIDNDFSKNKFAMQKAIIYGLVSVLMVFSVMLIAQFSLPAHYKFNGLLMACFDGILAGLFSIIFTYLPVKKLKKHLI